MSYDLPDDWNDMTVNDFCDWLEEHAWFPYENTKGQQILNIEDYTGNIRLYVNNALAEQEYLLMRDNDWEIAKSGEEDLTNTEIQAIVELEELVARSSLEVKDSTTKINKFVDVKIANDVEEKGALKLVVEFITS